MPVCVSTAAKGFHGPFSRQAATGCGTRHNRLRHVAAGGMWRQVACGDRRHVSVSRGWARAGGGDPVRRWQMGPSTCRYYGAAGGRDVFEDVGRESLQATTETILARAPDVILELRSENIPAGKELDDEMQVWSRLATVPAVRNKRVYFITGQQVTVPGPRVADGIERMAQVLHP